MENENLERYLSARELMQMLSNSRSTVYRLMDKGMPNIMVGSVHRFPMNQVVGWLESRARNKIDREKWTAPVVFQRYLTSPIQSKNSRHVKHHDSNCPPCFGTTSRQSSDARPQRQQWPRARSCFLNASISSFERKPATISSKPLRSLRQSRLALIINLPAGLAAAHVGKANDSPR